MRELCQNQAEETLGPSATPTNVDMHREPNPREQAERYIAQLAAITCSDGSSGKKSRDVAAQHVGIGRERAEALRFIFGRRGVPAWIQEWVEKGRYPPTAVVRILKAHARRHGGVVLDDEEFRAAICSLRHPPQRR